MKQLSRKEQVARFIFEKPHSRTQDIAEGLYITESGVATLLKGLIEDEAVTRQKDGRFYRYTVTEAYIAESVSSEADCLAQEKRLLELRRLEQIAEQLEAKGLLRRASTVWAQLTGMQNSPLGVGLIAMRRNQCTRSLKCRNH